MDFIKNNYLKLLVPLIFVITYVGWYYELIYYIAYIYIVIMLINAFIIKNQTINMYIVFMIPPLLTDVLQSASMDEFEDLGRYVIYVVPVALAYIMFIVQTIIHRKNLKLDWVMIGFIVYFATMIPSFFNTLSMYNSLLETAIYLNAFMLYTYFRTQKEIGKEHFMIMSFLFALQATLQMFVIFYEGDILHMILHKQISIGWSVSNNIGQYIVFSIPFVIYLASQYKKYSYSLYFLAYVLTWALFMSGARASWVALVLIAPFMGYYIFKNTHRKRFIRDTIILVPLIALSVYFLYYNEILQAIWERILLKGIDDSSRIDLWIGSIEHFKQFPIFGSGILTTSEFAYPLTSYHNIIIDAATSTGIVGLLGTGFFCFAVIKQLRSNPSKYNFMFSLALLTFLVNALLDTAHLNPIILMFIFTSLGFIETKSES